MNQNLNHNTKCLTQENAFGHALGTCAKFQLEIRTINAISGIVYFRKIVLESSRNVSETTPWPSVYQYLSGCVSDNGPYPDCPSTWKLNLQKQIDPKTP